MKTYFIFAALLSTVYAASFFKYASESSEVIQSLRQCLANYNIVDLQISDGKTNYLFSFISNEQQGCISACLYKSFKLLRPDGSLDTDLIFQEEDMTDSQREMKQKYEKAIIECRREVGRDECQFFSCFQQKKNRF